MVFDLFQKLLERDIQSLGSICSREVSVWFRLQGPAVHPGLMFMGPRCWAGGQVRTAGLDSQEAPQKRTVAQFSNRIKGGGSVPCTGSFLDGKTIE